MEKKLFVRSIVSPPFAAPVPVGALGDQETPEPSTSNIGKTNKDIEKRLAMLYC